MRVPYSFVCPVCERPCDIQGRSETASHWLFALYCHACLAGISLEIKKSLGGEGEGQ